MEKREGIARLLSNGFTLRMVPTSAIQRAGLGEYIHQYSAVNQPIVPIIFPSRGKQGSELSGDSGLDLFINIIEGLPKLLLNFNIRKISVRKSALALMRPCKTLKAETENHMEGTLLTK